MKGDGMGWISQLFKSGEQPRDLSDGHYGYLFEMAQALDHFCEARQREQSMRRALFLVAYKKAATNEEVSQEQRRMITVYAAGQVQSEQETMALVAQKTGYVLVPLDEKKELERLLLGEEAGDIK